MNIIIFSEAVLNLESFIELSTSYVKIFPAVHTPVTSCNLNIISLGKSPRMTLFLPGKKSQNDLIISGKSVSVRDCN